MEHDTRETDFQRSVEHVSEAEMSSLSRSTTPTSGWKDSHIDSAVQARINRNDRDGASLALAAADRARKVAKVVAMSVAHRASFVEGAPTERQGYPLPSHPQVLGAMQVTPTAVLTSKERRRTATASSAGVFPAKKLVKLVRLTEAALMQHTAQSMPLSARERLAPEVAISNQGPTRIDQIRVFLS